MVRTGNSTIKQKKKTKKNELEETHIIPLIKVCQQEYKVMNTGNEEQGHIQSENIQTKSLYFPFLFLK